MLPLYLASPVRSRHSTLIYVKSMTSFERLTAFPIRSRLASFLRGTRHALLTETDSLHLVALFSDNHMGLGGVARGALGFVET